MKITRVSIWTENLELTEPYTIAYQTFDHAPMVFVKLETDAAILGWGCCAPDPEVTGETAATVERSLRDTAQPLLEGSDPLRRTCLLEELRTTLNSMPTARAGISMALFDLLGKQANLPVWKILGGYRERIRTSVTIGILDLPSTLEKARFWLSQGFDCLKIKGGLSVESDIERVIRLREELGPDIELRFDANQGYTLEEALHFIRQTRPADLELLEQPTAKDQPDLMAALVKKGRVPIMADESLVRLKDAFKIARDEVADLLNVKLMKVGGLDEAVNVSAVARAAGLELMVGCMDETALGIAAGLHFALSRSNIAYADLDGHLELRSDPTRGTVLLENGYLYPSGKAGFGFEG